MQADRILKNGKVFSVKADGSIIRGSAVAIKDGIIIKVGTDAEAEAFANEKTDIIDCQGNTILPGMCDAHCHPSIACASLAGVDLFGIYRSEEQTADDVIEIYKQKLTEYIEANPDKQFIRGAGWVLTNFSDGDRYPTRQDLDEICADRPVALESFCQHNLWVNTKALQLGGLDENTPDVETGRIFREENGYPTGLFNDAAAMFLAKESIPGYNMSVEEIKEMFLYYQKEYANRYGVTMITDCMHSEEAKQAYKELAEEGRLTVRMRAVNLMTPEEYETQIPHYIATKGQYNVGEDFRIDTVKVFGEGEFVMNEPYLDSFCDEAGIPRGSNGKLFYTDDVLIEYGAKAMAAGYSVHIHAMGEATIDQAARCLKAAQEKAGLDNTRSVIAHLMIVSDEAADNMAAANIIANVQPRWMIREGDVEAEYKMFGEKAEESYPFRKFVDRGIVYAAGTDFPVTPPPSTIHEIHCWMNRSCFPDGPEWEDWQGRVLGEEEPATLAEAVKGLTWGGAYQMRMDEYAGTIEEGKSADLVVLDTDIESVPKDQIYKINVARTIFKGETVFEQ